MPRTASVWSAGGSTFSCGLTRRSSGKRRAPPLSGSVRRDATAPRSSHTGGGSWDKGGLPASWDIRYGSLTFHVKPMNFKHTGLFPEQAANWDWMQKKIREADRPISVLNLFAYTGGASVACLAASVCHVDAAKGMVTWAKDNAAASGVADANVRWIVDDCAKFVEREIRRWHKYDAIIMDPPSYGRGPGGEVWKLEDNLWDFVSLCSGVLSDDALFVLINSYTTGLAPSVLSYITDSIFTARRGGSSRAEELGLPVTPSGLVLHARAPLRGELPLGGLNGKFRHHSR